MKVLGVLICLGFFVSTLSQGWGAPKFVVSQMNSLVATSVDGDEPVPLEAFELQVDGDDESSEDDEVLTLSYTFHFERFFYQLGISKVLDLDSILLEKDNRPPIQC